MVTSDEQPSERMGPSRIGPVLMLAVALLVAARAIIGIDTDGIDGVRLALMAFAITITLVFLPLVLRSDVLLHQQCISGPAHAFGPFFGFKRISLDVRTIVRVGSTKWGYSYFESTTADRIYFDKRYRRWRGFLARLREVGFSLS
jgi:hypothetical protein